MLNTLLGWRKFILKLVSILGTAITIAIVYFFNWDIASFLGKVLPNLASQLSSKPALGLAINTSIITVIINLISEFFKFVGEFKVEIKNRSGQKNSHLDVNNPHRRVHLYIDCDVNFRNMIFKSIIKLFGGINLKVSVPHWVNYGIENKADLKSNAIRESKENFTLDLVETIQINSHEGKVFLHILINSKSLDRNHGTVIANFVPKSNSWFAKLIVSIMILFFFDVKTTDHTIEARIDTA
ncbi:hypothetical protein ACIQD3_09380 [Peribacillus loiseleuriae]|uniref:hypothetical protein n=1 Tax=Peribacillus loiseleuriae TaxID=1679170 RepID=UPI00382AEF4A